jgi:murein DD-endopeptidase MepM/ murein hydrolase activator NlpD
MSFRRAIVLAAAGVALSSCGDGSPFLSGSGTCGGYASGSTSAYKLPFAAGDAHVMSQGNCTTFTHKGDAKYAYDFLMNIGTTIVAARAGTVIGVEESFVDNNGGTNANYVLIEHSDGTVAQYLHLTQNGVTVALNDTVTQGQAIALSGNTGQSTTPHLHFDVRRSRTDSRSVPVTFSNTAPAESFALRSGTSYTAN